MPTLVFWVQEAFDPEECPDGFELSGDAPVPQEEPPAAPDQPPAAPQPAAGTKRGRDGEAAGDGDGQAGKKAKADVVELLDDD